MLELITAVVKPHVVDDVREALIGAGVEGMTLTEVRGFGRQKGRTETFRGAEYAVHFVPKVKVEVIVSSEIADRVVEVIAAAARTGKIGDGKIWRLDVADLLRVRTGEQGTDAV
jgi:nitrogen regulatory protein P-II 1